ncbi:MAG: glycosyltransferase family 2 protein [Alphaproteobacteria bacterium]
MNKNRLEKISLVVPCYNEEEALPFFYKAFDKFSKEMKKDVVFECLFINDGSKDKTLDVILKLAKKDERIKYISFSRNFGKEAAMYAGLEKAIGDYVTIVDADLQDPLEMIKEMYDAIKKEGYDCVGARRFSREGEPVIRSVFANLFYKLINQFSSTKVVNGARDFRLMTRQMVDSILRLKEYNRFSKGLFPFVGYKTKWLEYKNVERVAGATSWSFWGLFKYSLEGILAFSTAPLRLASILGLTICASSFLFVFYTFVRTLIYGNPVAGYPTLTCIIGFLGGIQLFCMGILGEYIAKIYTEIKNRPIYIVKDTNVKDN